MLNQQEKQFIKYWEAIRLTEQKSFKGFMKGLSKGLFMGIGIVLLLSVGWYERANMLANTQFNPFLFLLIIILIAVFIGFFYRQYQWEQKEQQYLELKAKEKASSST